MTVPTELIERSLTMPLDSFPRLLVPLQEARDRDVAAGAAQCSVCGCTENVACHGGCSWATLDPPTCSRCLA